MSKGPSIRIDDDDLEKIRKNIGESLIQIKQAIINPSFMISITPTNEKSVITRTKAEIRDGKSYAVSEEVKVLSDRMNIKSDSLFKI